MRAHTWLLIANRKCQNITIYGQTSTSHSVISLVPRPRPKDKGKGAGSGDETNKSAVQCKKT